jgi:hypothetical protein
MDGKKPPLYDMSRCIICDSPYVEWHHVYPSDRRPISDREGCVVPLCHAHHQGKYSVHHERKLDLWVKRDCQRRWERREGIDEPDHETFIRLFGCNYL